MLNRRPFRTYAPMHVVYKSKEFGTQLWLGDYYAATDFNLLKAKNVKSVFTAAAMLGVTYPPEMQMNHKTIQAFDMPSYKMTPHFQEAYNFIHEGLKKGNVLVHCAAGISRSATCVLVYLMKQEGYTFNQSLQLVRTKRSIVNPNYGFQNQLKRYEIKLKKIGVKKQTTDDNFAKNQVSNSEKKAVLNFLRDKNQQKTNGYDNPQQQKQEEKQKMNLTYGSPVLRNQIYNNFMRGKSLNYNQKGNHFGSTVGYTGKGILGQTRLHSMSKPSSNNNSSSVQNSVGSISKVGALNQPMNNQFLTFKLQAPKIVTIKK